MVLSAQFVGLTASAPKDQSTTAISVYYLSQQIGTIFGVTASTALLRHYFRSILLQRLDYCDDRDVVSLIQIFASNSITTRSL